MKRRFDARSTSAFTLVEVVLALGVTTFCLIALFGLFSVGLRSNQGTIGQAGASTILSAVVSDLYAVPPTVPPGQATKSTQFNIPIPANPVAATPVTTLYFAGDGQLTTNATSAQSNYRLTVTPIVPDSGLTSQGSSDRIATFLDLTVTWPAQATVATATGKAETFVALNRN